jgi:hypothetical protein
LITLPEFGACADAILHEKTNVDAAAAKKSLIEPSGKIMRQFDYTRLCRDYNVREKISIAA